MQTFSKLFPEHVSALKIRNGITAKACLPKECLIQNMQSCNEARSIIVSAPMRSFKFRIHVQKANEKRDVCNRD